MNRYKYLRTSHLPWSQSIASDDRVLLDVSCFKGKEIILTEKMDGECSGLYSDGYVHARSIDSNNHPSRDWLKQFWASRYYLLPDGWRIYAENVYAEHSIHYTELKAYALGFSLWEHNECKSWDDTMSWFDELGVESVPVLYRGIFDEELIRSFVDKLDFDTQEGYVIRVTDPFSIDFSSKNKNSLFANYIAKYVRKDHVQTDQHWTKKKVIPNELRK